MTRAEYEACQARDESGFRAAIEHADAQGPREPASPTSTTRCWSPTNGGAATSTTSSTARSTARSARCATNSSWFKLWSTLASREKAQELATTAAERVYRSDAMKKAIEGLGDGARQGDRQAHRARHGRHGRPGRRNACRRFLGAATGRPWRASSPTAPARNTQRRSGQGRRPGLDRAGAGRGQRGYSRHGGAGGAPPARQHGRRASASASSARFWAASCRWWPAASASS